MSKTAKLILFLLVAAAVGFAVYYFGFKKKADAASAADSKKAQAKAQYEIDMLNYIKGMKGQPGSWYEIIKNKLGKEPTDSQIIAEAAYAAKTNTGYYNYQGTNYAIQSLYN